MGKAGNPGRQLTARRTVARRRKASLPLCTVSGIPAAGCPEEAPTPQAGDRCSAQVAPQRADRDAAPPGLTIPDCHRQGQLAAGEIRRCCRVTVVPPLTFPAEFAAPARCRCWSRCTAAVRTGSTSPRHQVQHLADRQSSSSPTLSRAAPQRPALLELVPPGHQSRGRGSPRSSPGSSARWPGILAMADRSRTDLRRRDLGGWCDGGRVAATYPELFAAVGVHSAPPYRSASGPAKALAAMQGSATRRWRNTPAEPMPPMVVFQGSADSTVRSINAQRVADSGSRTARPRKGSGRPRGSEAPAGRCTPERSGAAPAGHREPARLPGRQVVRRRTQGARGVAGRRPGPRVVGRTSEVRTAIREARGPARRCGSSSRRTGSRPRKAFSPGRSAGALVHEPVDAGP